MELKAEVVRREKGAYRHYTVIEVPSSRNPSKKYRVDITNKRCSCPAWIYRSPRVPCKHLRGLGIGVN